MKQILLALIFNILFFVNSFSQDQPKDTLYIESVDYSILTNSSISCERFATNFKNAINFKAISNPDTLLMLDSFLDKLKYVRKNREIDVRAKLIYERKDKSDITICTNGYEVLVEGRLIKHNNRFIDFLRELIKKG